MKTKDQIIKEAFGEHYSEFESIMDEDGWVMEIDFPYTDAELMFKIETEEEYLGNCFEHVFRWRPEAIETLTSNNSWKETGYHSFRGIKLKECPLENGESYHIGFMNQLDGTFVYQGIKEYNKGFFNEDGYHLKPFPTHFQKIIKPEFPLW